MMTANMKESVEVYGIGNPLVDVLVHAEEVEIEKLKINKGSMNLVDPKRSSYILESVNDRKKAYSCGGSAPNTMVTLASLGVSTALAGMVGDDEHGRFYHRTLEEKSILSHLAICEEATGTSIVMVTPDHDRTMNTCLGACRKFGPENLKHETIATAKYLHFTGYMWDTESQKSALAAALDTARRAGVKVSFDLADPFAVRRHHGDFMDLIQNSVDVLFANREEASELLGYDDPEKASRELADKCIVAVVKNCDEGSCVSGNGGEAINLDANKVRAVDSTGAGDVYAAGFLYALLNSYSLAEAGMIASYLAAQIVKKYGAQFDDSETRELRRAINKGDWRR